MPARSYNTGACFIYIKVPRRPTAKSTSSAASEGATGVQGGLISNILGLGAQGPADRMRHSPPVNRPLYLGVCKNWPTISNIPAWEDIFADSDGRQAPADVAYHGQTAIISCLLTEYDDVVASILRQYQYPGGIAGIDGEHTRGNFLYGSRSFVELWVRWPHTEPAGNSVLLREPGRRYPHCYVQVDDIPEMGTSPMAIQFTFRAVAMRLADRTIQVPNFVRFNESPIGGRASGEGRRLQINLNRQPNKWYLWDFSGFDTLPPPTRQTAHGLNAAAGAVAGGLAAFT